MKKFLLGLIAGFLFAGLSVVILIFAAAKLGDRKPVVPDQAVLMLRLEGDVPERPPTEIPLPYFQSQSPATLYDVWDGLRKAEKDDHIKAIVLEPRALGVGWARLQEIRDAIVRFKRSGKPVYAYLRSPRAREYFLATAADKVYLTREDLLDLKGMRAEITFYKRTLDKIGVEMEIEHAGKYKDAGDMFTRTSMSPETREVLNSMVDVIYGNLIATIAAARGKAPDQVRALIDEGPFLAPKALEAKLIDGMVFGDQIYDELKSRLKVTEVKTIGHREYARVPAPAGLDGKTKVALVVGEGAISRGGDVDPFGNEEGIRSQPFIKMLREVRNDASVKGAILRINSPGGDAIASDEILHEVRALSSKKPVVISMSDVAASGGYFMAMSGDPVVASANTITGSIGVIYGKPNLKGLYDKLGLDTDSIKRGRFAEIDATYKPMTEPERAKLREGIDYIYREFLARVAEGRKRKVEQVEPFAQGRAWIGVQAKQNGLVDELGGLDRAVEIMKQRLKVNASENLNLQIYPRKRSFLEQLMKASADDSMIEVAAARRIRAWLGSNGFPDIDLSVWSRPGFLKMAPYEIRIQ